MTPHDHSTFVEGCYRCELSRDEVAAPRISESAERVLGVIRRQARYGDPVPVAVIKGSLHDGRRAGGAWVDAALRRLLAAGLVERPTKGNYLPAGDQS